MVHLLNSFVFISLVIWQFIVHRPLPVCVWIEFISCCLQAEPTETIQKNQRQNQGNFLVLSKGKLRQNQIFGLSGGFYLTKIVLNNSHKGGKRLKAHSHS